MLKSNKPIPDPMAALRHANENQSYIWLVHNAPEHALGVETAVAGGVTGREIYRFMLYDTGREELARCCQLASRHLERTNN